MFIQMRHRVLESNNHWIQLVIGIYFRDQGPDVDLVIGFRSGPAFRPTARASTVPILPSATYAKKSPRTHEHAFIHLKASRPQRFRCDITDIGNYLTTYPIIFSAYIKSVRQYSILSKLRQTWMIRSKHKNFRYCRWTCRKKYNPYVNML